VTVAYDNEGEQPPPGGLVEWRRIDVRLADGIHRSLLVRFFTFQTFTICLKFSSHLHLDDRDYWEAVPGKYVYASNNSRRAFLNQQIIK